MLQISSHVQSKQHFLADFKVCKLQQRAEQFMELCILSRYGLRNSLLVAPMPTASTAQILGNNESFEPYTSNIYTRRVLSGEFQV